MDKYSFQIFVKEKKKFNYRIVLANLLILVVVSGLSYVLIANEFLENSLLWILYILVMSTAVAYFTKMFKKEKYTPQGSLEGMLSFYKNKIMVGQTSFMTDQIKTIHIKNDDYVNKEVKDFGEFTREEGSFGVNNFITIQNYKNDFVEVQFKQNKRKEFENLRPILIDYYRKELFDYEDLVYLMKIEYDLDKIELKKELGITDKK